MTEIKYDGKWLQIRTKDYLDENGITHKWEYLSRKDSSCSVSVVPIIKQVGQPDKIVLIRQFRPAIGKYILGLPSGRVLEGENIETASLRELREETGFEGVVLFPPVAFYGSPESSEEEIFITFVEVNQYAVPDNHSIEKINLAVMEVSDLRTAIFHSKECSFDLRILSVFLHFMESI